MALIIVHLGHVYLDFPSSKRLFNLAEDWSVAEIFGYLKELVAAGICVWLFTRFRQLVLLAWAGILSFLALDDAFQGHEKIGGRIARRFDLDSFSFLGVNDIRGQDLGEMIAAGLFLIPILIAVVVGYRLADGRWRRFSLGMVGLLALLAFCGVLVDFFVNAIDSEALNIIEDGGEMFALSLVVWFTIRHLADGEPRSTAPVPSR